MDGRPRKNRIGKWLIRKQNCRDDRSKSFFSSLLEQWGPIFSAIKSIDRPVIIVSSQYGTESTYIRTIANEFDVPLIFDDMTDHSSYLIDAASQIQAMDLIISTSTTTAQLAGALGRPVWHMTSAGLSCGWYWMAQGNRTPWYPSMRLFRRDRWESPDRQVKDVAHALQQEFLSIDRAN